MYWNTQRVVADLRSIDGVESVWTAGQGGDVDTDNLIVQPEGNGDRLFIKGFVQEGGIESPSATQVDLVEVSDGLDSAGGLNSSHKTTCEVYGRICFVLRRAGFTVVSSLKANR